MYVHMCVSIYSGQKRVLNLLKLEVQDFASHSVCVLGSELGTSARASGDLKYWSISTSPVCDCVSGLLHLANDFEAGLHVINTYCYCEKYSIVRSSCF